MRRHDLDWLRVIAFLLLILYHTGMFFVPWSFHFKNRETSELFELWMTPLNQFRLPLLFMISGMGAFFAIRSRTVSAYLKERSLRLLLPLLFGMLVVVPPQIYFEHLYKGANYSSYWQFYPQVWEFIPYPQGSFSWHHLWYIPYIFIYSLLALPLLFYGKAERSYRVRTRLALFFSPPGRIYLLGLPLLITYYGLSPYFPTTHNLVWDWYNFTYSFLFFLYGILFISTDGLWESMERQRGVSWRIALAPFAFLWLFVWGPTLEIMREDTLLFFLLYGFLKTVFVTSCLLAILGYSRLLLNRNSQFLSYATEAVYPIYILHQSVMMVFGYYILRTSLGIIPKFALVVLATCSGSLFLYEIFIKRCNPVRILFGLRPVRKTKSSLDSDCPSSRKGVPAQDPESRRQNRGKGRDEPGTTIP
jgi:glucans biosynthesis protein C